jgi:hypothetical protein
MAAVSNPLDPLVDFPSDPDYWAPPEGWKEDERTKISSGGRHRRWIDEKGRERRRFDKGEPGKPGWQGRDHWHQRDEAGNYLDKDRKIVVRGSKAYHIPPNRQG